MSAALDILNVPVHIVERATGHKVAGRVRPAVESDKVLWTRWHAAMPSDAEDGHWEWDDFIDYARVLPERFAVYALEATGELQGLLMLEVSEDDVAAYGTHVFRVSTAPWNRRPIERCWGVGSLLVAVGILRSGADGHRGCMHLESLPDAEPFYQKTGMAPFDGLSEEGLRRFQFTTETGQQFLARVREKGLLDG